MQADDKETLLNKQQELIRAISSVVGDLVKQSGKSGRKISEEYDIGLGVISKLERNLVIWYNIVIVWR